MIKTIYKMDSKGRIRFLQISTKGDQLVQQSGLLNGATVSRVSFSKPKNIGKSNETTGAEQAVLEANAKIDHKLKVEYSETIDEARTRIIILPMLAEVYGEQCKRIDWTKDEVYVQPKLDGMRCLDKPDEKVSRENTPITTVDHIVVNRLVLENLVVDGELYAHGLSFQENMKIIKKSRPETLKVKYHIYDVISELPFIDRYAIATGIVKNSTNTMLVPTFRIYDEHQLDDYHQQFLGEGYEGTIIRWGNAGYDINKRSTSLLKYKDFLDLSIKLKDVVPNDGDPTHGTPVFHWKGAKDDELKAGLKMSHKDRIDLLTNKHKYIGKTVELRFFEYSDTGVPRFPVMHGFRLDK